MYLMKYTTQSLGYKIRTVSFFRGFLTATFYEEPKKKPGQREIPASDDQEAISLYRERVKLLEDAMEYNFDGRVPNYVFLGLFKQENGQETKIAD